jgi:flavin-dependent dehydrogenase
MPSKNLLLKSILILVPLLLLSNCAKILPEPKIITQTEYVERKIDIQSAPKAVDFPNVEWYVVSEKNLDEFLARVKADNGAVAFLAITPKGYENLALGIGDLRRYVLQQKEIIVYYEKAVTAPLPENK